VVLQAVQEHVQVEGREVVADQHVRVQLLQPRQQVRQQRPLARLRTGTPTSGSG